MVTEKQLKNLEKRKPFPKGVSGNPAGRPKKISNALKNVPSDIREKVYGILAYALTLSDEETAKKYLEAKQGELGKYGFVLQVAIRQLTLKGYAWGALMDIMDRLFGKPKMNASLDVNERVVVVRSQEEKEKLDNFKNLKI